MIKLILVTTLILSTTSVFSQTQVVEAPENGLLTKEQVLISQSPTERLREYLASFPIGYVITDEWYESNIELYPLNDLTEVELTHFYKYMQRFSTYGNP